MTADWRPAAACRDVPTEVFYPVGDMSPDVARARKVCNGCPVVADCLSWALEHHEHGIWGGTTDADRARIRHAGSKPAADHLDQVIVDRIRAGHPVTMSTTDRRRFVALLMGDLSASHLARAFGIATRTIETDKRAIRAARGDAKTVDPGRCGTQSNYAAHRRAGQQPCTPCSHAHSLDVAHRRRKRTVDRARGRAA